MARGHEHVTAVLRGVCGQAGCVRTGAAAAAAGCMQLIAVPRLYAVRQDAGLVGPGCAALLDAIHCTCMSTCHAPCHLQLD